MTDRPTHLIIVTHPGQAGLELFSAHRNEADAVIVLGRLARLLGPTGSKAHLIEVPLGDGVADVGELPPLPVLQAAAAPALPAPPAERPAPFRRLSQAEFMAETEAMEMNGGPVKDTPVPVEGGAFS